MEAADSTFSKQRGVVASSVAHWMIALSLMISLAALGLSCYYGVKISQLEGEQQALHSIIRRLASSEKQDTAVHAVNKRNADDGDEDGAEGDLSQLTLHDISSLRGPAGRDGRDGRDGKDCDVEDILSLIGSRGSSSASSTSSSSSVDQEELLQKFNESIGYALLTRMESAINKLDAIDADLENHQNGQSVSSTSDELTSINAKGGSTYVRWGRTTCGNNSEIVYSGFAAGQHYTQTGGAANYQCMPQRPEYSTYTSTYTGGSYMYGAEYETGAHIFSRAMQNLQVPCARCYAAGRSAIMMLPAQRSCPSSWNKEYEGYLMAGHYSHKRAYVYECVDAQPEALAGRTGDENGALFYFQQTVCSSTGHCPPYIESAELTCVVCSK